jgi:hypothetical protein
MAPDLNGINQERLRIELEGALVFRDGATVIVNAAYLYRLDEDARGRTKAVKLLPGPLLQVDGNESPSYAELLEAFARVLRENEVSA